MARGWRVFLALLRLSLVVGAVLTIAFVATADLWEFGLDDRVYLETTSAESRPGPDGEPVVGADVEPLHLMIQTPRFASLCPDRFVELRDNAQGSFGEIRPTDCPAARAIRQRYGADPTAAIVHKVVLHPPGSVRTQLSAVIAFSWAALLFAVLCLERLLTAAAKGGPFARGTVRWVRGLAIGVAGLLIVVPNVSNAVVADLTRTYLPDVPVEGFRLSPWSVVVVLLVAALAEVWRRGVLLQRESEATV